MIGRFAIKSCCLTIFSVLALSTLFAAGLAQPAKAQFSAAYDLIKAVEDGEYTELRTQMQKCRCPNVRTVEDVPVLVIAARNSDVRAARFLLESGGNPNAMDRETKTNALMAFARRGKLDGVELMIEFSADLNAGDATGETALMKAVRTRNIRVLNALLDAGADIYLPDYQGRTAIDLARNLRYRDVERILSEAS